MRTILITGVGAGIGRELLSYFLAKGYSVIGLGRTKPNNCNSANFHFYEQDLNDLDSLETLSAKIASEHRPQYFIHNAMYSPGHKPFLRYKSVDFQRAHNICSVAPFIIIKKIIAKMREQNFGRIVFLGSAASISGTPGQLVYLSAKAALDGLTKGLSLELATSGVSINQMLLGPVNTEKLRENVPEERREALRLSIPTETFISLEDIQCGLDFIFAEKNNSYTGQKLIIAGGLPGRRN